MAKGAFREREGGEGAARGRVWKILALRGRIMEWQREGIWEERVVEGAARDRKRQIRVLRGIRVGRCGITMYDILKVYFLFCFIIGSETSI